MKHRLINADCLTWLYNTDEQWTTIFADPPDNIGLKYGTYKDKLPENKYVKLLDAWLHCFLGKAQTVWFSFNAKWLIQMGWLVDRIRLTLPSLRVRPCVQTFTFGQHRNDDLGYGFRPLWRFQWPEAPLLPDAIRVPSWRLLNGDKRANPKGRVPSDVMDFPRVTGNSKQRRAFHPTQLHEGLIERCIKLTTPEDKSVLDPFGGTGTTLRVCRRLGHPCTLIELDPNYCQKIVEEHLLISSGPASYMVDDHH